MAELRLNQINFPSMVADYGWGNASVDYALDVHFGEPALGGNFSIARPFTDVAISEFDFDSRIAELFQNNDLETAFRRLAQELGDKFTDVIDNHDWGIDSNRVKRFRNSPTWKTITDSGDLRDSQTMVVEVL